MFGTLQTNLAVKTVERVLGMSPPEEHESVRRSMSDSPLGVIAQGLIRTTDGKRAAFHGILVKTDACKDYIQRGTLDKGGGNHGAQQFDGIVTSNKPLQALVETGPAEPDKALTVGLKPNELPQALRGRC